MGNFDSDIHFPQLDATDVGTVYSGLFGKILLRKAKPFAALSDCLAK